MPFLIERGSLLASLSGTLFHQVEVVRNSYASSGPADASTVLPAFFRCSNPVGGAAPYGSVSSSAGDRRGSALLAGDRGASL